MQFHSFSFLIRVFLFTTTSNSLRTSAVQHYNGKKCTAERCKIDSDSLRFFHLADWGGRDNPPYVTTAQTTVATTMNRMGKEKNVHFVLSLGDHFYFYGVKDSKSKRFKRTFDDVYTFGQSKNVPWYISAGNHDYYGSVAAQMEYSRINPRWVYPKKSYQIRYQLKSKTKIDIIAVDTVVLCGGTWYGGLHPRTKKNETAYDLPKGPSDPKKAEELWKWLEQRLSSSSADYLLVASHYPVFSLGYHGDFTCPGERMQKLFQKYDVSAYLVGHDHNLQYIKSVSSSGWIVHHILSGAGNALDRRKRPALSNLGEFDATCDFFYPQRHEHDSPNEANLGGFVYAEFGPEKGSFLFYSGDGYPLYKVHVVPRTQSYSTDTDVGQDLRCHDLNRKTSIMRYSGASFPLWNIFGDLSNAFLPLSLQTRLCSSFLDW